jgi:hypothetical protein
MAKAVGKVNKAGKTSEHVPHLLRCAPRPLPQAGEVKHRRVSFTSPVLTGEDAKRSGAGEGRVTVAEGRMEGKFPS